MPTWWGRKSSKSKEQPQEQVPRGGGGGGGLLHFNFTTKSSPTRNGTANKKGGCNKTEKPKSFDDAFRNSPRASRDFLTSSATAAAAGSSSGFSCWDSDSGEKRGLPLPRPSVSSNQSFGNDQGLVFGSASVSGSSVSSTGSYDDHPIQTYNSQINGTRLVMLCLNQLINLRSTLQFTLFRV